MPGPVFDAPLVDPLHEKEIFASDVADVGFVHGNIVIPVANLRFEEPVGDDPPKAHRFVVGRLVLTHPVANQLMQRLQNLVLQLEWLASRPHLKGPVEFRRPYDPTFRDSSIQPSA
jgi:hypothetical protein